MAFAFHLGMSLGTGWLGLPFGFAALLFVPIALVMFKIQVK
jgi:hypothetical protein